MADESERRSAKLDRMFKEYLVVIHSFIDELRAEHGHSLKRIEQNEVQIGQLKEQGKRLIDIQAELVGIVKGINGRLSDHEGRLSAGGI